MCAGPPGGPRWCASLARSIQGDGSLIEHTHPGEPTKLRLWWGPVVAINPGDVVVLMPTVMGPVCDEVVHAKGGP